LASAALDATRNRFRTLTVTAADVVRLLPPPVDAVVVALSAGDHHLYVVDAQGNASPASKALVRQRRSYVDDKAAGVTYSGTWPNRNDTQDLNGLSSLH
jgi:hypothetical protein